MDDDLDYVSDDSQWCRASNYNNNNNLYSQNNRSDHGDPDPTPSEPDLYKYECNNSGTDPTEYRNDVDCENNDNDNMEHSNGSDHKDETGWEPEGEGYEVEGVRYKVEGSEYRMEGEEEKYGEHEHEGEYEDTERDNGVYKPQEPRCNNNKAHRVREPKSMSNEWGYEPQRLDNAVSEHRESRYKDMARYAPPLTTIVYNDH